MLPSDMKPFFNWRGGTVAVQLLPLESPLDRGKRARKKRSIENHETGNMEVAFDRDSKYTYADVSSEFACSMLSRRRLSDVEHQHKNWTMIRQVKRIEEREEKKKRMNRMVIAIAPRKQSWKESLSSSTKFSFSKLKKGRKRGREKENKWKQSQVAENDRGKCSPNEPRGSCAKPCSTNSPKQRRSSDSERSNPIMKWARVLLPCFQLAAVPFPLLLSFSIASLPASLFNSFCAILLHSIRVLQ